MKANPPTMKKMGNCKSALDIVFITTIEPIKIISSAKNFSAIVNPTDSSPLLKLVTLTLRDHMVVIVLF